MRFSLLILILLHGISVFAQEQTVGYRNGNFFEFSAYASSGQVAGTLDWHHLHGIGKSKRFKLGYGVRFTSQFGKNLDYLTAPAELTSETTGLGVLFSETIPENIDTVSFSKTQFNALNLAFYMEYAITKRWDVGFNIDVIGFSFGARQEGKYLSSKRPANLSETQYANPTSLNLLLTSDNDIGSLNSEFFLRYWLKSNLGLRAGAGFLFTEYTTENKLRLDNDRFRNKALLLMFGLTYSPFR